MQQRVSVITLGIADMARSRRFYESGLGWTRGNPHDEVTFYQLDGMVLSLFGRTDLAEDSGIKEPIAGFGGMTLGLNVGERAAVDTVLAEAEAAGGRILKPAQDAFWGGYHGHFADPDGHVWEVAWNPEWRLSATGRVELPYPATAQQDVDK